MLKKLSKLSVILVLLLLVSSSVARASGKMEVALGEKVTLQAEDVGAGSFKWVAKKGKSILSTQETSIFNYTFDQQGEYSVNLTVTDMAGNTKNTTVMILVGNRYSIPTGAAAGGAIGEGGLVSVPLAVNYETLPIQSSQREVHIVGNEGRVVFDIGTRDDILEYRIDRNIYLDSDGNGIANDDIDNADDPSYLRGGTWQTQYTNTESTKIAAEVTVVNRTGQKAKSQVEILFDAVPGKEGNVVAVLDTLPALDPSKKKIYVYDALDTVAFYARRSQGDVVEYRIDKNIFVDSDGDGNPGNDIDNRTDASFKNGDVWTTAYEKTDQQIIAQLIVVGRTGAGSRIQREIAFTDKPVISIPAPGETTEAGKAEAVIRLTADKEFVQKGDPIVFKVEGLTQSMDVYSFDWDFNGDGTVDQSVEGDNTVSYIFDTPGIQPVKVRVQDADGNEASFQLDMLVQDVAGTTADFEFSVEGGTVKFTNLSVGNPALADKSLKYTWSFGDTDPKNFEAQKDKIGSQNPVYTYVQPGTYVVTLTVADADLVASTKSADVVIQTVSETATGQEPATAEDVATAGEGGSFIWTMLKVILYIVLGIILLVVLIVLGLLVFLKVQHPDLVFEELIDEVKIKILGMLGIHEMIEPGAQAPTITSLSPKAASFEASARAKPAPDKPGKPVTEPAPEIVTVAESAPEPERPVVVSEPPAESTPVPDWLKKTTPASVDTTTSSAPAKEAPQVIEGEVEEEKPKPDQTQGKGPVPDWLKNA